MKSRTKRTTSQSFDHLAGHGAAIASAAKQQTVAESWERPFAEAADPHLRQRRQNADAKPLPGWDAAFRRVRGS
jgi:hypothetical protein